MTTPHTEPIAAPSLPEVEQPAARMPRRDHPGGKYDGPGIYPNLTETDYHQDPTPEGSLSASGCKTILRSPAKYNHEQLQGNQQFKDTFDFGKAAHALVLGAGAELAIIDAPDWRTKDAKAQRDEAREEGLTPILKKDHRIVQAMADQLHQHPTAGLLLDGTNGTAEQTLIWEADGITKRARLDWLPADTGARRFVVPDYKTTSDDGADPVAFAKAAVNYGYHQQADFYLEGVRVLLGVTDPAFVFIVQEKTAPYLVNVIELSSELMLMGSQRNERAIRVFKECRERDEWPGYGDSISLATAPTWSSYEHADNLNLWGMTE